MITILKKFRAVVFGAIALFLYLLGYKQAKENTEIQQMKGELHAIQTAKKVRNNLSNPAVIKRLHNKYRR